MKSGKIRDKLLRCAASIADEDAVALLTKLAETFPETVKFIPPPPKAVRDIVSVELEANLRLIIESELTRAFRLRNDPPDIQEIDKKDRIPARVHEVRRNNQQILVTVSLPSWLDFIPCQATEPTEHPEPPQDQPRT